MWLWLAVLLYPAALALYGLIGRLDRFSALTSGLIVFLLLWLAFLPRDLTWPAPLTIEPRFAVPLTAYLAGLAVAALLMSWTVRKRL